MVDLWSVVFCTRACPQAFAADGASARSPHLLRKETVTGGLNRLLWWGIGAICLLGVSERDWGLSFTVFPWRKSVGTP